MRLLKNLLISPFVGLSLAISLSLSANAADSELVVFDWGGSEDPGFFQAYIEKYGENTVVLMEVGSFFEIYAVINDEISVGEKNIYNILNEYCRYVYYYEKYESKKSSRHRKSFI